MSSGNRWHVRPRSRMGRRGCAAPRSLGVWRRRIGWRDRARRAPNRPHPVRLCVGRWHDRARVRRCSRDQKARRGGAGDGHASAGPALASSRLERHGDLGGLGALAHRAARRLQQRSAGHGLRPGVDSQVGVGRGALRRAPRFTTTSSGRDSSESSATARRRPR